MKLKTNLIIYFFLTCVNLNAQKNSKDTIPSRTELQKKSTADSFLLNQGMILTADDLSFPGTHNLTDALQGRVSGLDVISTYSGPGSGFQAMIRRQGTKGFYQPLIVLLCAV